MFTNSETAPKEVIINGILCFTQIAKSASNLGFDLCTMRFTPKGAGIIPVSFSYFNNAAFISIIHASNPSDVR